MARNNILARENRIMINEMKSDISCIRKDLRNLTNHYSKRLPVWATIIMSILTALVTGFVVALIK